LLAESSMNTVTPSAENVHITFRHFSGTDALEARVREGVTKLFELFPKIIKCDVALEMHHRQRQGHNFRCRVDLVVPNAELVAENPEAGDASVDVYVALGEVFDEATRQLEDYVRRARWDVKQHEHTPHARVAKLMVGEGPGTRYGFLETHDGREIYFHEHSVLHHRYDDLEIGTEVRFAEEEGEKGPQASTVVATKRRSTVTTTTANADEIRDEGESARDAR
jgi:cold shock CspA family protein/ribosome-associated translation inhibitor RaiA